MQKVEGTGTFHTARSTDFQCKQRYRAGQGTEKVHKGKVRACSA